VQEGIIVSLIFALCGSFEIYSTSIRLHFEQTRVFLPSCVQDATATFCQSEKTCSHISIDGDSDVLSLFSVSFDVLSQAINVINNNDEIIGKIRRISDFFLIMPPTK
jgi:hypothetical protein